MIIHEMEQGTDEWYLVKKGKMSASHAQAIGSNGKGLNTYITKLAAEYLSCGLPTNGYSNVDMQRGKELEPDARTIYALKHNLNIRQVGFIELSEFVGCSPDALVGEDGGLEIKCHDDLTHFKLMNDGVKEISSTYIWQIQMNLLITGRQWWDYVAYNPNYEHIDQNLLVFRIHPDSEKFQKLQAGLAVGEAKLKALISKFKTL